MGRGRFAVAVALSAAVLATAMPGWASPVAPAPTASVATYVQGVQLPASVATATWSKVVRGCAGELAVSGPTVSGATTVATGNFTSRWFRPRNGRLVELHFSQDGNQMWQPLPEGVVIRLRLRDRTHGWSPWWNMHMTFEPASPPLPAVVFKVSAGVGVVLSELSADGPLPVQQVQLRLVDSATSTGVLEDTFAVKLGC